MPALWDDGVEAIDVAPVHWGASTILTIFFASCLVSALFFGLGYSFGTHGEPTGTGQPEMAKLGAGWLGSVRSESREASVGARREQALTSSAISAKRGTRSSAGSRPAHDSSVAPTAPKAAIAKVDTHPSVHPVLRSVSMLTPVVPVVARRQPPRPTASAVKLKVATGPTHVMVQIAAVRSRGNARTLVSQLRRKGFHARIYAGVHDPYLHVQIGPFSSVSQAQAMRHRVRSSGYRAVLK